MMRAVVSPVLAALAAVLAAGQPGCHRDRLPQGDASTGALPSSASAAAASPSPAGSNAAAGGAMGHLDAARADATGATGQGAPPPSIGGAGAVSPVPGTTPGAGAPAGRPFDQDAWLAARGVAWRPDASCWSTLATSPPRRIHVCSCHEALSLPEIELMVCSRAREPDAAEGPFVTHTVLYAPRGGALEAVLDVPTGAMLDDCPPRSPIPCRVALELRVERGAIHLEEKSGAASACGHPGIMSSRPIPGASGWNSASGQRARAAYRRVCGARGRYGWERGMLRRAP
ncbi:hypothetical protein WMF31_21350 [Sorangium sp. So ce1036]|uniref:hypothetical protein n=1 Tax=Sorangium sp. So ce1036 TaxID=3133328 RepID=UPI003EFDB759